MLNLISSLLVLCIATMNFVHGGIKDILEHPRVKDHIFQLLNQEPQHDKDYKYRLAAIVIFQDEAPYLKEWIEYHLLVGIEHFYLYNNLSHDNYAEILKPYVKKGIVDLIDWDMKSDSHYSWTGVQSLANRNAIDRAKKDKVKWLAIIDADEFLVPRNEDSIPSFLKHYENETIGGVKVGWVMFGTSYVPKIPSDKTLIETLLLNEGYKPAGEKSIVRPFRVDPVLLSGPHVQNYIPGFVDVAIPTELFQLNHYWSRDENYLNQVKIPRRILWGTPPEECQQWAHRFNLCSDASKPILRFVPELRRRLGLP